MAEKYPDITDWNNLNKYADMFKTSESGDKGQLLDGDPSYVTNDEALVKNLDLDYQVVVGGSEAALIQSFKSAEQNKTPLLAYFYEPQWFFSEMKLVKVDLPPYTDGLRRRPGQGRLRLPAVRPQQADLDHVRGLRLPGRRPDQELQLDQRRPEPGLQVHRRGRHESPTTPPRSGSTTTRTRWTPGSAEPGCLLSRPSSERRAEPAPVALDRRGPSRHTRSLFPIAHNDA